MKELDKYLKMDIGDTCSISNYWCTRVPGGLMLNNEIEKTDYTNNRRYHLMTDTFIPFSGTLRQTLEQL